MSHLGTLTTFLNTKPSPGRDGPIAINRERRHQTVSTWLTRLLQINMAALAALGTFLLAMGQQSRWLMSLALVASLASLLLVDLGRIFAFPGWVTNILLVGALVITGFDVLRYSGPLHVLIVANLLVYIQCVLQFQRKDVRIYRYLLMLSIFQVVSACAFFHGVIFGLLLVVYLILALTALLLVTYFGEWGMVSNQHVGRMGSQENDAFPTVIIAVMGDPPDPRSPLGINWGLLGRVARLVVSSALFSGLVFLIVPRLSTRPWPGLAPAPLRTVGFDAAVTLEEVGDLLDDPTPVMRVELATLDGKPLGYVGPLYLRGGSLQAYYEKHWSLNPFFVQNETRPLQPLFRGPGQSLFLQRVVLERTQGSEVFAIWPVGKWDDSPLLYDTDRTRVLRVTEQDRRATIEMTTSALEFNRLADLVPAPEPVLQGPFLQLPWIIFQPDWWGGRFVVHRELYYRRGWDRLEQLATKWAKEAPWPEEDHFHIAKHFEQILAFSGKFQYSGEAVARDPQLDPVVDFLTETRKGHCEYFATALALLLRCRGIPTRIVIGYKTEEFNTLGGFYQARQRDAHAWVEAYLSPDKLSPELLGGKPPEVWKYGAWLRLDPTPSTAIRAGENQTFWQRLWTTYTFLDYIWLKYVMQLDKVTQQSEVYQPVRRRVQEGIETLVRPERWRETLHSAGAAMRRALTPFLEWYALGGILAVLIFGAVGLLWVWRDPLRRIWIIKKLPLRRSWAPLADNVVVQVHRELERMLQRAYAQRLPAETPRAFVERVAQLQFAGASSQYDGWTASARRIVELYYRFRFGNHTPTAPEIEEMAQALHTVRSALRARHRRNG
ncbi:transglutaminaseTgpA domain-containing protein [Thermogutta sp.]|uniref:transglutaminase TgpA family protein n=1 Tax=Thermogutta sp. TaxID=1962930 RepID=UPI00321FB11A